MSEKQSNGTPLGKAAAGPIFAILAVLKPIIAVISSVAAVVLAVTLATFRMFMWVFYLPLNVLLKFTPLNYLVRKKTHDDSAVELVLSEGRKTATKYENAKWRFENDLQDEESQIKVALLRGDLEGYAEMVMPKVHYPLMWTAVPSEADFSIVVQGRMFNGRSPAVMLAGAALTPEYIKDAWARSTTVAIRAAYCAAVVLGFTSLLIAYNVPVEASYVEPEVSTQEIPAASTYKVLDLRSLASTYTDIYSQAQASELNTKLQAQAAAAIEEPSVDESYYGPSKTARAIQKWIASILLFGALIVATIVISLAGARLLWLGRFRAYVAIVIGSSVSSLNEAPGESTKLWDERAAERELLFQSRLKTINEILHRDRSPLIYIGESMGTLERIGHPEAPLKHSAIALSIKDCFQHISFLGATGEGKSYNGYEPIAKQLLCYRQQGYPIGIFAMDTKNAIGKDLIKVARDVGLSDDHIRVIGTSDTLGIKPYRVDLLDGLTPVQVADRISSVAKQLDGPSSAGNSFWDKACHSVVTNVATVVQALERTDDGLELSRRFGMRLYSFMFILKIIQSDSLLISGLLSVTRALQDVDGQYGRIAQFVGRSLDESIADLQETFLDLHSATKDGIVQTVRTTLSNFKFSPVIAEGFGDGLSDRLIPASELRANAITIIGISMAEHGLAGKLVLSTLKSLFQIQTTAEEAMDPVAAKAKQDWWNNPQPGKNPGAVGEAAADQFAMFFMADEFQELATSSGGGDSDTEAWNTFRSTCTAGVIFGQNISSYNRALGREGTDKMLANFRSRVYLRTEDEETLSEIENLFGKVPYIQSGTGKHKPSLIAVRDATGVSADDLQPVCATRQTRDIRALEKLPFLFFPSHSDRFAVPAFTNDDFSDQIQNGHDANELIRNLRWDTDYRTYLETVPFDIAEGEQVHERPAVDVKTISIMGRGCAVVSVQRAGCSVKEFVQLTTADKV